MLIAIQLLAGIALLYYGAEWLVKGGVGIAARLGIPPLIIGLTLVSFATSAPELVVSVKAALAGSGDISIGNVVGSNICNVGLILGLSALITPLAVEKQLLKFDVPVLIAVSLLLSGLGIATGGIGRIAGAVFFLLLIGYVLCNVRTALKGGGAPDDEVADEVRENRNMKLPTAFALVAVGLAALVGGAHLLVEGAVAIGDALGISKAVIGLTVVAIGTSLPELATSVVAAIRHQDDIAIGNVVGSNIFNILCIMGIAPLIRPVQASGITWIDWSLMLFYTILLYPMVRSGSRINRWEGGGLLAVFVGYMAWLVINAAG